MMSNDRVAIIGATGSGKTWLAIRLLPRVPRFVALTADDMFTMADVPVTSFFEPSLTQQIIFIPDTFAHEQQKWQAWDAVQRAIFRHGDRVVYYDELRAINPGTNTRPAFEELVAQGRKRNIGVWMGMQRPRGVARIVLSQAEHFLILSTRDPDDRKYLAAFIGEEASLDIPYENHAVFYANVIDQSTHYFDLDQERRAEREAPRAHPAAITATSGNRRITRSVQEKPLRATVIRDSGADRPYADAVSLVQKNRWKAFFSQAPPPLVMEMVASTDNVSLIPYQISMGKSLAYIADGLHADPRAALTAIAWAHDDDPFIPDWVRQQRINIARPPIPIGRALRAASQDRVGILGRLQRGDSVAAIAHSRGLSPDALWIASLLLFSDVPGVSERLDEEE